MDIFDRLGNLIRTILDDQADERRTGNPRPQGGDRDFHEAWEELEAYMNSGGSDAPTATAADSAPARPVPEYLRKDFRNLEVPFGAPLGEVRRSYKRLMAAFHPDRHSSDPERFRTATEVTKKLNQSFQRIRAHYEMTG